MADLLETRYTPHVWVAAQLDEHINVRYRHCLSQCNVLIISRLRSTIAIAFWMERTTSICGSWKVYSMLRRD